MITHEPLPLYEAFSFLTGIANDFSIEEFFEAMYIKHISKAEEYGKRCRILLEQVVALLAMGEPLPDKNRDHDLSGDWAGHRECHILPDWLLVYRIEDDVLVLTLARTGTHSDLFGK